MPLLKFRKLSLTDFQTALGNDSLDNNTQYYVYDGNEFIVSTIGNRIISGGVIYKSYGYTLTNFGKLKGLVNMHVIKTNQLNPEEGTSLIKKIISGFLELNDYKQIQLCEIDKEGDGETILQIMFDGNDVVFSRQGVSPTITGNYYITFN